MRVVQVVICYLVVLMIFGCGGSHRPPRQRVLLPPTLNLAPHRNIGLFVFSVENAKGNLHEFATQRFEEYVLAAQARRVDQARILTGGDTWLSLQIDTLPDFDSDSINKLIVEDGSRLQPSAN